MDLPEVGKTITKESRASSALNKGGVVEEKLELKQTKER